MGRSLLFIMTTVGDGKEIEGVLKEIFELMDKNHDGSIDQDEGIAIGVAMGESEEQAKKSWKHMVKDMDDVDANQCIELGEWQDFYKKSLKDAPLEDVLTMLNSMKDTIKEHVAKD